MICEQTEKNELRTFSGREAQNFRNTKKSVFAGSSHKPHKWNLHLKIQEFVRQRVWRTDRKQIERNLFGKLWGIQALKFQITKTFFVTSSPNSQGEFSVYDLKGGIQFFR